jgi:hypothetical protein
LRIAVIAVIARYRRNRDEEEIQSLPGKYEPVAGRLLLALWDGRSAGVIALRPLEEPACAR